MFPVPFPQQIPCGETGGTGILVLLPCTEKVGGCQEREGWLAGWSLSLSAVS